MGSREPVRDFLEGVSAPLDRPMVWNDSLAASGSIGKSLSQELKLRFPSPLDTTTEAGLEAAIARMVYIVQQSILGAACMAKFLHVEIEKLDTDAAKESVRAAAVTAYRAAFSRQCTTMQVTAALAGLDGETEQIRKARFVESLDLLPAYDNDAIDDSWPNLGEGIDGIEAVWIPFISKKTGFILRNLPMAARALYIKCLTTLTGDAADDILAVLRLEVGGCYDLIEATERAEQQMLLSMPVNDGGEDNLVRHYRRWNQLASVSVITIRALFGAMTSASRQPFPSLAVLREADPYPWPKISADEEVNGALKGVTVAIAGFVHEHNFLAGEGWVLTPPGTGPSTVPGLDDKTSKADGIKFLQGQLQNKASTYRIPRTDSTQRDWEAWFSRMAALQGLFPGLPAKIIIPMLIGLVPIDDKRIFGWVEKTAEMQHRKQEPTLDDFLNHVREQVMANAVTRREAYMELDKLTRDYRQIEDCQSLSTKLQQLWTQLFPPVTAEIEPIGKLEVLRMIHNLLQEIRLSFKGGKTVMMRAWSDFNYDHTAIFVSYIDTALHTSKAETDRLSVAFLQDVSKQLQQAHRMSVQVGPNASLASHAVIRNRDRSKAAQPKQDAAALEPTTTRIATWIDSTGANKKRARSGERSGTSGGKGGGNSRGRSEPSTPKTPTSRPLPPGFGGTLDNGGARQRTASPVELETDYRVIFDRMKAMPGGSEHPQDRIVGHLRGSFPRLKSLSYDEAVRAVLNGGCTLCQQEGHIGKFCPFLKQSSDSLRQRVRDYNSMLREARKKQTA
jgi:hypothetical protein